MYAVIETGGKQYRVAPGDVIQVETLPGEVGSEIEFDRVLTVVNDANEVVAGAALGRGSSERHYFRTWTRRQSDRV